MDRTITVFSIALMLAGCATQKPAVVKIDDGWGPGVTDVTRVQAMLKSLLTKKDCGEHERYQARVIISTLTCDQATYLCRTAPEEINYDVVMDVIDQSGDQLMGITRTELLKTLGPPADNEKGGWVVYGNASDSGSGWVFSFDENDRVIQISHAN